MSLAFSMIASDPARNVMGLYSISGIGALLLVSQVVQLDLVVSAIVTADDGDGPVARPFQLLRVLLGHDQPADHGALQSHGVVVPRFRVPDRPVKADALRLTHQRASTSG